MEIENYPGYFIYEDGSIYSNKSKRWMKAHPNQYGYLQLALTNEDGRKCFRIHRLVAMVYLDNPHNYPEVDHIDRDILNNHLYNLRWVTHSMNQYNTKREKKSKNNKSGHKNISFDNSRNKWIYTNDYKGIKIHKRLNTKIDALCYKFIMELRYKKYITERHKIKVAPLPHHLL